MAKMAKTAAVALSMSMSMSILLLLTEDIHIHTFMGLILPQPQPLPLPMSVEAFAFDSMAIPPSRSRSRYIQKSSPLSSSSSSSSSSFKRATVTNSMTRRNPLLALSDSGRDKVQSRLKFMLHGYSNDGPKPNHVSVTNLKAIPDGYDYADDYDDDDDDGYNNNSSRSRRRTDGTKGPNKKDKPKNKRPYPSRTRFSTNDYRDEYNYDYDYDDEDNDGYDRYDRYDRYDDDDDDEDYEYDYQVEEEEEEPMPPSWEWETYRKTTHIYLPPPMPMPLPTPSSAKGDTSTDASQSQAQTQQQLPQAIIHFIGGTFFGSYPLQFYKPLLEQIAQSSNSILIATSIPITLSLDKNKNPLNHYLLSKQIAKQFNRAYRDVIVDEYGSDASAGMKIVGVGHSLGSRLHAILCTSKKLRRIGFERDANVFVAFNNYSAVESVPGVKSLERGIQDTLNGNDNGGGRGRRGRDTDRFRSDAYYDEYEIGLEDVVNAVSEGIQDQVSSLKTAITPDLDKASLEFQPSPQQLWDGMRAEYDAENTLMVQFDQDMIDQSSKLAGIILETIEKEDKEKEKEGLGDDKNSIVSEEVTVKTNATSMSEDNSAFSAFSNQDPKDADTSETASAGGRDIKFARLRGTHLTPVSYSDTIIVKALKRTGALGRDFILQEAIQEGSEYGPSSKKKRKQVQNQDLENLGASIARYVTDVVIGSNKKK